jgi:hypothetical protein
VLIIMTLLIAVFKHFWQLYFLSESDETSIISCFELVFMSYPCRIMPV